MNLTNPIDSPIPEFCSSTTTADQSKYRVPPAPGGTVDLVTPGEPPVVADQTPYPQPPLPYSALPQTSTTEWRLVDILRAPAARPGKDFTQTWDPSNPPAGWDQRDPLAALAEAARALAGSPTGNITSEHQIRALADLAVTGRLSYSTLSQMGFVTAQDVLTAIMGLHPSLSPAMVLQVVERAQRVAWAIRGSPSWRAALRPTLGWIGVSGEDDAPHRPCNVFSLPVPQYDFDVPVGDLIVTTRVAIAEAPYPPPINEVGDPATFLPPDDIPTISRDLDVIFLYMPGDASRIEEAADLIPAIFDEASAREKTVAVVSFDMIGWGYSARRALRNSSDTVLFDQSLFPTVPYPDNPPALQFAEDFVVALLNTLSTGPPFIDLNRAVPIGGSLGGNLALRLGRRKDLPWLKGVCGWSPASVWPSKEKSPDTGAIAGMGAGYGAAAGAVIGAVVGSFIPGVGTVLGAALGAALGAIGVGIGGAVAAPGLDQQAIDTCTTEMNTPEDPAQRQRHFAGIFDNATASFLFITFVPPQATMWYRDDWQPCKDNTMTTDRLDRRETYDATFRRWHWRISQDQLVYSHRDNDPATGIPRYLLNTVPMLLAAGVNDDYQFAGIYSWTRDLADKMTVPGASLFLNDTGHSIHNERPMKLAHAIFDFLEAFWRPGITPKDLSYLVPLLLED